jgi:hypothetical protein
MAHHNCQYTDESGWGVVEVVRGFCEVGQDCVKSCPFSFHGKKKEAQADKAYREFCKELEGKQVQRLN